MVLTFKKGLLAVLTVLSSTHLVSSRKITIKNKCGMAVYPAHAGKGGTPTTDSGQPAPGGWEMPKDGSTVLNVPEPWADGRIWVRSGGCDGNVANCKIGKCVGNGISCDGTEYGSLGATVAEFGIKTSFQGQDFYDVSMVEGFTISMTITPSDSSCTVAHCGVQQDLLKVCDSRLIWPKGSSKIYGCANPCTAGVQFVALGGNTFNPDTSPSCCHGDYRDDKCTTSVIPFYDDLKKHCNMGYVYAKDDPNDAVFTCVSDPEYTVELCSGGNTGVANPPSANQAVTMNPGSGGALNVGGGGGDSAPGPSSSAEVPAPSIPLPGPSPSKSTDQPGSVPYVPPSPSASPTRPIEDPYTSTTTVTVSRSKSRGAGGHTWGGNAFVLGDETASGSGSGGYRTITITSTQTTTVVQTCSAMDKRDRMRQRDEKWQKKGSVWCP